MFESNSQRLIELIARAIRTVLAFRGLVVNEIARATSSKERRHVFATRLAGRRGESVEFMGRALNG